MRLIIGCEESGRVRDAFIAAGHDAISCDLLPTASPGPHYQGDIFDILDDGWDGGIFFPPCTFMANSGAKHLYLGMKKENGPNPARWEAMREGAEFARRLWNAKIPKIAMENPVMLGAAKEIIGAGRPTQIIQPWMFGHPEMKATCLWLKGFPKLIPTNDVYDEMLKLPKSQSQRVHMMPPGPNRAKERSKTFPGIAAAMGSQWGTT